MQKDIIFISESLNSLLKKMTNTQKETVKNMLHFYMNQYRDLIEKYDSISVAASIHTAIDEFIEKEISTTKEYKISCGKGCSFCCHLSVDISIDEAELLVEYCKEQNITIDQDKLKSQLTPNADIFNKLPIQDRKCVFLDESGCCTVYEHRPSACRKLIAISEPKFCDVDNYFGAKVSKLVSTEAEVMTSASLNAAKETGTMAEMLLKTLKNNLKNV